MLDLNKLNELAASTVDKIMRDYPEQDKIYLHINGIIQEAVRQHAEVMAAKNKMTDLKKLKSLFNNLNIEILETCFDNYIEVILCYSNIRFMFDSNGSYTDMRFDY